MLGQCSVVSLEKFGSGNKFLSSEFTCLYLVQRRYITIVLDGEQLSERFQSGWHLFAFFRSFFGGIYSRQKM